MGMTMIGGTIATDDRGGDMGMAIATVTVTASTVTETKLSYFLLCTSRRNFSKNGGAIIAAPFFLIGAATPRPVLRCSLTAQQLRRAASIKTTARCSEPRTPQPSRWIEWSSAGEEVHGLEIEYLARGHRDESERQYEALNVGQAKRGKVLKLIQIDKEIFPLAIVSSS